jgi:hypothetical protein
VTEDGKQIEAKRASIAKEIFELIKCRRASRLRNNIQLGRKFTESKDTFTEHGQCIRYYKDLPNTMSVITVVGGNYTGGELCFPRYRIAFALRPGDVLFFPGQELLHGNLPINGNRLSVVCYCERLPAGRRA